MKARIDINCDLGESYGAFIVGNDQRIMRSITSANIACGFHAGDPVTMMKSIEVAEKHNVAVGAHPGFPDLLGFGRREIQLTSEETKTYIMYQISALRGFAEAARTRLQHVKPHGALYNMAVADQKLSKAIVEGVKALDDTLIVFAPPKSALAETSAKAGLRVAYEFFADRAYNSNGSLVSRKQANAVIGDPQRLVERATKAVTDGTVLAIDGTELSLGKIHTICVHGDTPAAVKLVEALRKELLKASVKVEPAGKFV